VQTSAVKVLDDPLWMSLPRDLDIVELWSGTATICAAGQHKGHRAHPFDKIRSEEEDLTSTQLESRNSRTIWFGVAACSNILPTYHDSLHQALTDFAWP